ncbi:MAG: hypothetical protein ACI81O_000181 [Cyclobacteriaceae bacterium]|jgi:hypothetical protein
MSGRGPSQIETVCFLCELPNCPVSSSAGARFKGTLQTMRPRGASLQKMIVQIGAALVRASAH